MTGWLLNQCTDYFADYFAPGGAGEADALPDHEIVLPFCHSDYDNFGQWSNLAGPYSIKKRCIAGRSAHDHTFDYVRQFAAAYNRAEVPWLLAAGLAEAHEGSLEVLAGMDGALATLLRDFTRPSSSSSSSSSLLTSRPTVILLLSDHGSHMGPHFQMTEAGRLEHRLPLLFLIAPHSLLGHLPREARAALEGNQQALTTPLDVHRTLLHLVEGWRELTGEQAEGGRGWEGERAGLSLFTRVPPERTCYDAGVPSSLCPCAETTL